MSGMVMAAAGLSPHPAAGVLTASLSAPYAQFGRVTYTDTASAYDSKLSVIILQPAYAAKAYVAQLRAENPNVKVLAYQSFWLRPTADPSGETSCLVGSGTYPSSWYMTSSAGKPEVWQWPSGAVYQMDFGNMAYQQACAKHAILEAHWIGADGVFFDGLATSLHWAALPTPCTTTASGASATCTSDANWQNAMTGALTYLGGQLHAAHLLIMGNIGGGNVSNTGGGGPAVWQRYNGPIDGAMEEAWTYGTNHLPLPALRVQTGISNVAWSEAHGKDTIVNDDITNCAACSAYGVATLMLAGQGHSIYDISNGSYNGYSPWWSSYDTSATVGPALGNYYVQANGLLVRKFTVGSVVVNDTASAIVDPAFGTVPAHSAIIP